MSTDYKFQGWMGLDKNSAEGNMKWQEYEPKKWEETDVEIKVSQVKNRLKDPLPIRVQDHPLWHLWFRPAHPAQRLGRDALPLLCGPRNRRQGRACRLQGRRGHQSWRPCRRRRPVRFVLETGLSELLGQQ